MAELLVFILIVVLAARFLGELMEKMGQLSLLGELLAGILLGVLFTYGPFPQFAHFTDDEAFKAIANLGMVFLMLMAGMEMDVRELIKASKIGMFVALGGIVLPLGLGFGLGMLFIPESEYQLIQAFLLGVVLSITAVPALSRVLMDLKLLNTKLGRTIMSAAIADDILGLMLLAVLTSLMTGGALSAMGLVILVVKVVGFFAVALVVGKFLMPHLDKVWHRFKSKEMEFSVTLVIALAFGIAAEYADMHFIVGVLVGGMFIREGMTDKKSLLALEKKISGIALGFLAPIFFVSMGFHVDLSALGTAPLFVLAVLVAAILGKVIGCWLPAKLAGFSTRESIAIGIGMNGRGAVEIIVAAVAMEVGLFSVPVPTPPIVTAMFSAIVIMAIVTTIMVPIGMKLVLFKNRAKNAENVE